MFHEMKYLFYCLLQKFKIPKYWVLFYNNSPQFQSNYKWLLDKVSFDYSYYTWIYTDLLAGTAFFLSEFHGVDFVFIISSGETTRASISAVRALLSLDVMPAERWQSNIFF